MLSLSSGYSLPCSFCAVLRSSLPIFFLIESVQLLNISDRPERKEAGGDDWQKPKSFWPYSLLNVSKFLIRRGDKTQVAPHFTAGEFYSKSVNAPASHDFYTELVEAVSFLRGYYGTPWRITSTYRPDSVGSQHRECRAVDSQPANMSQSIVKDLVSQLLNPKSEVFRKLRSLGITGFGVYDTFVHLDCRTIRGQHSDSYGSFAFWDERKKKAVASTSVSPPKKPNLPKVLAVPTSPTSSLKSALPS